MKHPFEPSTRPSGSFPMPRTARPRRLPFGAAVRLAALSASALGACGGDESADDHHESEVITTVTLSFHADSDDTSFVATWDDPDGDGGEAPSIDPIELAAGETYRVDVGFEYRLESPPEDITEEIREEADEHQLFFLGSAFVLADTSTQSAPLLVHRYLDEDEGGRPVGLSSEVQTNAPGSGTWTLVLRHLPAVHGAPQKVAGLAEQARTEGVSALPGESDVHISFPVTVR